MVKLMLSPQVVTMKRSPDNGSTKFQGNPGRGAFWGAQMCSRRQLRVQNIAYINSHLRSRRRGRGGMPGRTILGHFSIFNHHHQTSCNSHAKAFSNNYPRRERPIPLNLPMTFPINSALKYKILESLAFAFAASYRRNLAILSQHFCLKLELQSTTRLHKSTILRILVFFFEFSCKSDRTEKSLVSPELGLASAAE